MPSGAHTAVRPPPHSRDKRKGGLSSSQGTCALRGGQASRCQAHTLGGAAGAWRPDDWAPVEIDPSFRLLRVTVPALLLSLTLSTHPLLVPSLTQLQCHLPAMSVPFSPTPQSTDCTHGPRCRKRGLATHAGECQDQVKHGSTWSPSDT